MIRFVLAVVAEIALCAALHRYDDWTLEQMPAKFVGCALLAGIAFFVGASQFPIPLSPRRQAIIFWGVAITLRLVALPLPPGDDIWRYQWEGRIQHAGFNPYIVAPNDDRLEPLRASFADWPKINHLDFAAIYPPGAELIFNALSRISDSTWLYKILFAAADLATAAVLLKLIGGNRRFADAAWYAWNPLVVYSFAGAAHFDSLMLLPMMGGILFLQKHETALTPPERWRWAIAAALCFGAAISVKLVPVFLLLLGLFSLGRRAFALIVSVVLPASLALFYGFPRVPIFDSLRRFAYVTRLNDLFWWLIEETVWPNPRQKNYHYNVVLIGCVVVVSLVFIRNWRRGMLWVLGAVLILSPVLHPWYCTWILPLAAWRRAVAWQVLSITLFVYFLFWNERLFALPWHTEPWQRAIIVIPPLTALAMIAWRKRNSAPPAEVVAS
ncbi:MAG: hypothetical protein M3Z64_07315 [Verrucomicrobiota bacterium]|nr:hypothetical protein [Verrucomicrobiota bacterium]